MYLVEEGFSCYSCGRMLLLRLLRLLLLLWLLLRLLLLLLLLLRRRLPCCLCGYVRRQLPVLRLCLVVFVFSCFLTLELNEEDADITAAEGGCKMSRGFPLGWRVTVHCCAASYHSMGFYLRSCSCILISTAKRSEAFSVDIPPFGSSWA